MQPRRNRRATRPTTQKLRQTNTRKTNGAQPIPQTRKMQLRTTIHRIPRSTRHAGTSTDGRHQNRKSTQLETTHERHRSPQILGVHGILSLLHQGLFETCTSPTATDPPIDPLDMGGSRRRSIRDVTKGYDRQTSTTTTGFHETLRTTHGRIRLWRGSHTLTRGRIKQPNHQQETQAPPCRLLLSYFHRNRTQL